MKISQIRIMRRVKNENSIRTKDERETFYAEIGSVETKNRKEL